MKGENIIGADFARTNDRTAVIYTDSAGVEHVASIIRTLEDGRAVLAIPHSQFYPIVRL